MRSLRQGLPPTMRFVSVKAVNEQAAAVLVSVRERLIRNRTQLASAIRGYTAEFGISVVKELAHIPLLLERIQSDETVPELTREVFASQVADYAQMEEKIGDVDARLMAWQRADEHSKRLNTIPGIGPIGAALLIMETPAPELFRSGPQFAAWIGLTPKDHSTGGKLRLVCITRAGDEALGAVLVTGQRLLFNMLGDTARPLHGWPDCSSASRRNWQPSHSPTRWRVSARRSWCPGRYRAKYASA
jgi:transposase